MRLLLNFTLVELNFMDWEKLDSQHSPVSKDKRIGIHPFLFLEESDFCCFLPNYCFSFMRPIECK